MNMAQIEYYAFISYRHLDKQWAKWMQGKLESYIIPSFLYERNDDLPSNYNTIVI